MRQGNQVEGATVVPKGEGAPDHLVELLEREELRNREFADWNDELRLQEIDFVIHPGRTIPDLVRRWDAVAARWRFAGKTTADRREVNLRAHLFFTQSAELLEPAEEGAPRRPRERFAEDRFFHPGRLADEHHFAQNGSARNRWRYHPRTATALPQARDMFREQLLFA